jgi:hypothetical protein
MLAPAWSANAGIVFATGTDLTGSSKMLALPTARLEYSAGDHQQFSFWYTPKLQLTSYDEWIRMNPYFSREIAVTPERVPINLGIGFTTDQDIVQVNAGISFSQWSNKAMVLADSGKLWLDFVKAMQTRFEINAGVQPSQTVRIKFSGLIQPTYEDGSSDQLPMTPLIKTTAKLEYDFPKPVTAWASVNYWSEQNTDSLATRTLDGTVLLNIGASTTMIPKVALSASINNLLGSSYYWWEGYKAPGLQILLEAKVNLK